MQEQQVVVVGAGLAGLVAALTAQEYGARSILLIEKMNRVGGNSAKASSGINGVTTGQIEAIEGADSVQVFNEDTLRSGDGLSQESLVDALTARSGEAIQYLNGFGTDLSVISLCGGHTYPRTHRQPDTEKPKNVGMHLISTLHEEALKRQEIQIIVEAAVTELLVDADRVVGVKYQHQGHTVEVRSNAVILATGGYSASAELLQTYRQDLKDFPTTNGDWALGEAFRLVETLDVELVHMDKVQVHPTAFIDPKNLNSRSKFLAGEMLRGYGGILVNQEGRRFVNELGRRDHVTHAILSNCKVLDDDSDEKSGISQTFAYMILNEEARQNVGKSFGFYLWKGFFKQYASLGEFGEEVGIDSAVLEQEIESYRDACSRSSDQFGKTQFSVCFDINESIYVARITPAIHYTMGGMAFDVNCRVKRNTGALVDGLFACGECTGGLHGENRLGGNSLLECVVFGRIAGQNAAQQE